MLANNISNDTIFIAGEIVKGGKQDRVIAKDIVIHPGEEVDLGAFCVEKTGTKNGNKGNFTGHSDMLSIDIKRL